MKQIFDPFAKLPYPSKKTVLLILVVAALTILLSAVISVWLSKVTTLKVPSLGTAITLGVEAYWDENCENKTETVDWGIVWPGSSKNISARAMLEHGAYIYLKHLNVREGVIFTEDGVFNTSEISFFLNESNQIYSNGDSDIYCEP